MFSDSQPGWVSGICSTKPRPIVLEYEQWDYRDSFFCICSCVTQFCIEVGNMYFMIVIWKSLKLLSKIKQLNSSENLWNTQEKKYKIEIDHKKRQKTLDKTNIFIMGKKP